MDTLAFYNAARRDVKTNAIPYRNDEGAYQFNPGQSSILSQSKFQHIALLNIQIDQHDSKAKALRKEMIAYQSPSENIISSAEKSKNDHSPEIEEELDNLKLLKSELKQYDEDMISRGIIPEESFVKDEQPKNDDQKKKSGKINWKAIISFFVTWGAGEVFMTYTQFNSLRYDKAVEGIVARSVGFAVVLFLVHWVALKHRQHRKAIYTVFLAFSFLMISIMLFGPLIINQFYPEGSGPSIKEKWSINAANTGSNSTATYPVWVEMLRRNDMMPAIMVFLFFLIMTSFSKKQKKEVDEPLPEQQPQPTDLLLDEVTRTRNYYKIKIRNSEARLAELRHAQKSSQDPAADSLYNIFKALKEKQQQEAVYIEERDRLIVRRQMLLSEVQAELSKYQVELKEAINNDPVKSTVVKPDWCTELDVINYYKIRYNE